MKHHDHVTMGSRIPKRNGAKVFFLSLLLIGGLIPLLQWLGSEGYIPFKPAPVEEPPYIVLTDDRIEEEISVVTWNIEWFPGQSPGPTALEEQQHMQDVRRAIREIDADVYLLQEMRNFEVVEELFRPFPEYDVHIVSRFRQGFAIGRMQLAVVSRLPAVAAFA